MSSSPRPFIGVHYSVPRLVAGWELSEETMPQSLIHDRAVKLLQALFDAWAERAGGSRLVARDLAVRWDASQPSVGVDPDVSVFVPAPSSSEPLRSVRTWIPGQAAPVLAVEVVSETNPHKDYVIAPDKYAASGTGELWVFDPLLAGAAAHGGPFRLQIWQRRGDGDFVRIYAGDGPARSPALGAYLVPTDEGQKLRIADDDAATRFWLTAEEAERAEKEAERAEKEAERAEKEAERAEKEAERAAKEAALARIAELEAALAARGAGGAGGAGGKSEPG